MDKSTAELISSRSTVTPKFIYACLGDELHRMNLLTGEQSCIQTPAYVFKGGCAWSEFPGGILLLTGGFEGFSQEVLREVVKIDTLRECAVSSLPPMHTARGNHATVYHSQYVYVLGGFNYGNLSECERYSCEEGQWEVLPALPVAGDAMSAVEGDNSLYVLGGRDNGRDLDTVQKLCLNSLIWELMQLKLPQACWCPPCFKTDSYVYLVIKKTLYAFTPYELKPLKTVPKSIRSDSSYYSRGTLYCSWIGDITSLAVGELTSL
jgi:hypothetical protein